ncbi:hypothetical protein ACOME3_007964 [Neoechinorhynchus agilis]
MFSNKPFYTEQNNLTDHKDGSMEDLDDQFHRFHVQTNSRSNRNTILQSNTYANAARSLDESLIANERSRNLKNQLYKKTVGEIEGVFNFYKYCIEQRKEELVKELIQAYADLELSPTSGLTCEPSLLEFCQFRQPDLQSVQLFIQSNFGYIDHSSSKSSSKVTPKDNSNHIRRFTRASFNRTGSYGSSMSSSPMNEFHLSKLPPTFSDIYLQFNDQRDHHASPSSPKKPVNLTTQLRRHKIMYHMKIGQFGNNAGQFTEPSGIAVNANDDILVADTNNHRIQVFSKEGHFIYQFGECGKRDGQLLYPNRVTVYKPTGEVIITERSPTHQVQVFSREGKFIRKFGSDVLQHPRGVCVDNRGNIIVVECKVMRVFIFDMLGNILNRFTCAKLIEFPNAVAVNAKDEIFISDNRSHCVKVFSYAGTFIRSIGSEGITNFPIAIGIEDDGKGDILVADNHNSFNLTIFSEKGILKGAFESKIRHAQCYDAALMSNGRVVLSSKDYHIYVYRYHDCELCLPFS